MFFKRNSDGPLAPVPTRRPGGYVRVSFCDETRRFSGGDSWCRFHPAGIEQQSAGLLHSDGFDSVV